MHVADTVSADYSHIKTNKKSSHRTKPKIKHKIPVPRRRPRAGALPRKVAEPNPRRARTRAGPAHTRRQRKRDPKKKRKRQEKRGKGSFFYDAESLGGAALAETPRGEWLQHHRRDTGKIRAGGRGGGAPLERSPRKGSNHRKGSNAPRNGSKERTGRARGGCAGAAG